MDQTTPHPEICTEVLENCTRYRFPSLNNTSILEYRILPGIRLCLNRMYTTFMPVLARSDCDHILINYGLRGRSEQTLTDGNVTFVAAGDLAIAFHSAKKGFLFPGGLYEGIELYIEPETVRQESSGILKAFGMDLSGLLSRYGRNGFYKSGHLASLDILMKHIWQVRGTGTDAEFAFICTSTLEILRMLLFENIPETKYTNLSQENVARARAYRNALMKNLQERIPAKDAARSFGISETSLKNYFRIVYGENVSSYMKKARMKAAADYLSTTRDSIGDIAAKVGFSGQSKFSAAFRAWSGMSPGEYRKRNGAPDSAHEKDAGDGRKR